MNSVTTPPDAPTEALLAMAYDQTLDIWDRLLDLRDHGTFTHTRRAVEATLRLARACGLEGEALAHVRRGALLHDIGKIGVPDQILLKPSSLTPDEWEVMKRHPVYVYEVLSGIPFFQPALEIPYCHHERWDGSGYPRGLKGKDIPLAARIFSIIDVWDALLSDRPYRPAWSTDRVHQYLRAQSGKHFDPEIVELFFRTVVIVN